MNLTTVRGGLSKKSEEKIRGNFKVVANEGATCKGRSAFIFTQQQIGSDGIP